MAWDWVEFILGVGELGDLAVSNERPRWRRVLIFLALVILGIAGIVGLLILLT